MVPVTCNVVVSITGPGLRQRGYDQDRDTRLAGAASDVRTLNTPTSAH
jgi:hypothetical protein